MGSYVILLPAISEGANIAKAPPIPAIPPDIIIVSIIFLLPFIPAYSAANLLNPVAFNSYPKVVFSNIIYKTTAIKMANIIPTLTLDPATPNDGSWELSGKYLVLVILELYIAALF